MTFLTALIWIIPIIFILFFLFYLHVIVVATVIKMILLLKGYFSLKKRKESLTEQVKKVFTEDLFLLKHKYKNRRLLSIGFGLFFMVHFSLFVYFYQNYNVPTKSNHFKRAFLLEMIK